MFEDRAAKALEISPWQVAELLAAGADDILLVDVREEWELARGVLPGAVHRPLSRFAEFDEWPEARRIVIYCEHGVRSLDVAVWLRRAKNIVAESMHGGFAEWKGPVATFDRGEQV